MYNFYLLIFTRLIYFSFCLDIEVACYEYEGVDAVKNALRSGLNMSSEEFPIKVVH